MSLFTLHLARVSPSIALRALLDPPTPTGMPGLRALECMMTMKLGSPLLSTARMQLRSLAVFASWESEEALETFFAESDLGEVLVEGWHVRLELRRRWGGVVEFPESPAHTRPPSPEEPVVAVTLARAKIPELPRFTQWGKPVEELVRDHPGATLALAALRPPRTFSTFSVWRSEREMLDMVRGRDPVEGAKRHAVAMVERRRRDFHHEFTTLRFHALSEHGEWEGRSGIVPRKAP